MKTPISLRRFFAIPLGSLKHKYVFHRPIPDPVKGRGLSIIVVTLNTTVFIRYDRLQFRTVKYVLIRTLPFYVHILTRDLHLRSRNVFKT